MGRRRILAAAVLAVITGSFVVSVATSASAATSSREWYFINKINAERESRGIPKLTVKSDLVTVARNWSGRMAEAGDISHNPNLAREVGGNWTVLGENVGVGANSESLHQAFMDSPGHRANVLDRDYNQVGVGIVIDADGMIFVTENFAHRTQTTASRPRSSTPSPRATPTASSTPRSRPRSSPSPAPAPRPSEREDRPEESSQPAPQSGPGRNVEVLVRLVSLDG